jgi:hypothetical protein
MLLQNGPTACVSAARRHHDRQPSKLTPNFGSWAGRVHAVLGALFYWLQFFFLYHI